MRQIEASAYLSAGTVSAVHASLHAVHFCSTPDSACAQQPVRRVRSASGRECGQEQHAGESWRSAQSSRTWRPSKEIRCACMGHAGGQVWEWRRAGGMCRRCGGEGRDAAARSGDAVLPRTGAVNLAGWSRRNTLATLNLSHDGRQVSHRTWRLCALAPFECGGVSLRVGVRGYPVCTECGNACGSKDLQTHFFAWAPNEM